MRWAVVILEWLVLLPLWRAIFKPRLLRGLFATGTALVWLIIIIVIAAASGGGDDNGDDGQSASRPTAGATQPDGEGDEPTEAPEQAEPTDIPEPTEVPHEVPLAVGSVAEAEWVKITINNIIDPYVSDNEFDVPQSGNRYIVYDLTIENVSDNNHFFGITDFRLTGADNFQYEWGIGPLVEPSLSSFSDLGGGNKIQGLLGFEVRQDTRIVEMKYDPNPFTTEDIYFRTQ